MCMNYRTIVLIGHIGKMLPWVILKGMEGNKKYIKYRWIADLINIYCFVISKKYQHHISRSLYGNGRIMRLFFWFFNNSKSLISQSIVFLFCFHSFISPSPCILWPIFISGGSWPNRFQFFLACFCHSVISVVLENYGSSRSQLRFPQRLKICIRWIVQSR